MPRCQVHNVGFYRPQSEAIYSMALDKTKNRLAVARSDATIEIWNLTHLPFIERTMVPNLENFSIEGLCWLDHRLFSVGLHGWLMEYNLFSLDVKNKWAITGEAGTCLDGSNNQFLAVGTEQGYVNIYGVHQNGVQFEKFLDKQEGRILCLKYDTTGEFVVGGSLNAIRIWNVKTGHAIHKMVLGRSEAKKETLVWCLEVMSDFTIFSGDSRGVLTLWDGKMGAQIESHQSHKADITAICLDEKEESIYCAGVDPLIANYEKVRIGTNTKWVKSIQRKIHDHDVRAMVFHKDKLYSAGLDTYLICSYHPPKTMLKYAPILQNPCAQIANHSNIILLRYRKHLEVWRLGQARQGKDKYVGVLELVAKPKKVLVIQKLGKNWEEKEEQEGIVCSCISSGGQYIFMGTSTGYCLYESKELQTDKPKLTKIDDLDDSNLPCVQATFSDKHQQLIVALATGRIIIYDLEDTTPFISQRIERDSEHLSDTVSMLKVSKCGKLLAIADTSSNIVVYKYTSDGYTFRLKLPRYKAPLTAIGINNNSLCILMAYSDSKVLEYNLKLQKYTDFSRHLENSSGWKLRTHPIRNIAFTSDDEDIVLLHDDSNIIVVKKNAQPLKPQPKSKVAKLVNGDIDNQQFKISSIQKYRHLVYLDLLDNGDMVAVEVNPLSILEHLPPAFAQKTFGNK